MTRPNVKDLIIAPSGDMRAPTTALAQRYTVNGFAVCTAAVKLVAREDHGVTDALATTIAALTVWYDDPNKAVRLYGATAVAAASPHEAVPRNRADTAPINMTRRVQIGDRILWFDTAVGVADLADAPPIDDPDPKAESVTGETRKQLQALLARDPQLIGNPLGSDTYRVFAPHVGAWPTYARSAVQFVAEQFERDFGFVRKHIADAAREQYGIVDLAQDTERTGDLAAGAWLKVARHIAGWRRYAAGGHEADGAALAIGDLRLLHRDLPSLFDAGDRISEAEHLRLLHECESEVAGSPSDAELAAHETIVAATDATARRRRCFELRQRLWTDDENRAFAYLDDELFP